MNKYKTINQVGKEARFRFWCALCLSLMVLLAFSLVMVPISLALAATSNTTLAQYIGTVRISNNGTTESNVFTTLTLTTQELIDGDFVSDNCLNTAMLTNAGADTTYMPGVNASYPWAIYVPSILQNSSLDYKLHLGGAQDMDSELCYFPGAGGMTSANFSIGDNFTIEQKGFVDTSYSADKFLVYKEDALEVKISAANEIKTRILSFTWTSPDGHNDPTAQWSNEANAYDDNTVTDAEDVGIDAGAWSSFLELNYSSNLSVDAIRFYGEMDGTTAATLDIDIYTADDWLGIYEGNFTKNQWETFITAKTYSGNATRIRIRNDSGVAHFAEINEVDFGTAPSVIASGISSDNHTVKTVCEYDTWLEFDGTDSVVNCGTDASLDITGNLTIEAWIYPESYGEGNYGRLLESTLSVWRIMIANSTRFQIDFVDGASATQTISTDANSIPLNTWTYFALTYDGATLQSYINGTLQSQTASFTTNLTALGTDVLYIGNDAGTSRTWDGLQDEIRIYARALPQSEITANFASGRIGKPQPSNSANLCAWWHFDEGTGATAYDETANNNDGTISNETWNGEELKIYVDNMVTPKDTAFIAGKSVPDTPTDWTFLTNNAMPYMEYQKIWIDGVLQQHIIWQYDTVFDDLSAGNHDATPTFRTESSNADVSAELISFSPVTEAEASAWSVSNPLSPVSDNVPAQPPKLYTENVSTDNIVGGSFWNDILDEGHVPRDLFWLTMPFILAVIAGMLIYFASGSLLFQVIVMAVILAAFAATALPFWPVIVFIIDAVAIIVASKQFGWV